MRKRSPTARQYAERGYMELSTVLTLILDLLTSIDGMQGPRYETGTELMPTSQSIQSSRALAYLSTRTVVDRLYSPVALRTKNRKLRSLGDRSKPQLPPRTLSHRLLTLQVKESKVITKRSDRTLAFQGYMFDYSWVSFPTCRYIPKIGATNIPNRILSYVPL